MLPGDISSKQCHKNILNILCFVVHHNLLNRVIYNGGKILTTALKIFFNEEHIFNTCVKYNGTFLNWLNTIIKYIML
jgi:hypothetical protein